MRVRSTLGAVGLIGILLAGCGPSAGEEKAIRTAEDAVTARRQAEGRAVAAETEVATLRDRLAATVKERDKARAELDLAKQSMLNLRAEAQGADEKRQDAEDRARAEAISRQEAEAAASARAREATDARTKLSEERSRPAPSVPEAEAPPTKPAASGKASAACAAIAETINLRRDLTDPAALEPSYLEWLVSEGGWDARDVSDLGAWIRWVKAGAATTPGMSKNQANEVRDTWEKHVKGLLEVRSEFLDGDTTEALRTFRYWRPRVD